MKESAIAELLASHRTRIFALDRYLEARAAFALARAEVDRTIGALRSAAGPAARRRSSEVVRAYAVAECAFISANADLQRYHQHVDAACERIYVGHLQRRPDGDDLPFAFVDDDPKADARERAKALKPGDWVRIWSPGRRRLLACGTVRPRSQRSQDGVVSDAADIDVPLLWFDGSCPAEWATPHRT